MCERLPCRIECRSNMMHKQQDIALKHKVLVGKIYNHRETTKRAKEILSLRAVGSFVCTFIRVNPESMFLQKKFQSVPTVFVSAQHERRGVKHDASSVWVEDLTTTSFKICVRELQNFDGAHQSIHVVSSFTLFTKLHYLS